MSDKLYFENLFIGEVDFKEGDFFLLLVILTHIAAQMLI